MKVTGSHIVREFGHSAVNTSPSGHAVIRKYPQEKNRQTFALYRQVLKY